MLAIAVAAVLALFAHPVFAAGEEDLEEQEVEEQIREANEQFTEEIQNFLSVELPEAVKRLEQYQRQANSPSAGPEQKMGLAEALMYFSEIVEELTEVREYLPEAYEKLKQSKRLEIEAETLSERHRISRDDKERGEIEKEMKKILKDSFDLSQDVRRLEALELEKELNEINAVIKKREENRDIIIDRRLQELLHGEDPFEW
jgi:hypothetical protein